jgi:hypothetical protein
MASGDKNSMPEMIFVIFNGYEVRYYTTVESFAAAITDGYADQHEVKCFVPAEWADDRIDQAVLSVAKKKPLRNLPTPANWHAVMSQHGQFVHPSMYTPAQKKFAADWTKKQKAHRKQHKDAIANELTAALGRKV